jgi:hypothetical protein
MAGFSRSIVLFSGTHQIETPKRTTAIPPPAATEQPDDGLMRIKGSGAAVINLNHSESENHTRSVVMETERTYDIVRIKNPDNPSQHVDVKRPRKVNTQSNEDTRGKPPSRHAGVAGPANVTTIYAKQPEAPEEEHIEILEENITDVNDDWDPGGGGGASP